MYSVVFFVKKKAGMSRDDFARYWIVDHTPLTAKVAGIRSYRCWVFHEAQNGPYDGVGVITFDDKSACDAALASPAFQTALKDAENFQTVDETVSFFGDEHVIV